MRPNEQKPELETTGSAVFDFSGRRVTGEPAFASLTVEELAARARQEPIDARQVAMAKKTLRALKESHRLVVDGVDPNRPEQAGWGIVFPESGNPKVREALAPLIDHRCAQVSTVDSRRHRILDGAQGYRRGETRIEFLNRQNASHDIVDPSRFPYYLLVVGSPEEIPFSFQSQLDLNHGVGRLDFETPGEYAAYARGVVEAEEALMECSPRTRRAVFFCPTDDEVSERISREMVIPLVEGLKSKPIEGWNVEVLLGEEASRERLLALLEGRDRSDLLFTAGHGLVCPADDVTQRAVQGGLCCQGQSAVIAADLGSNPKARGLVTFHFACFGAGTDCADEFETLKDGSPLVRTHQAFTARLPRVVLSGGGLATFGHIGRTWTSSFSRRDNSQQTNSPQLEPFEMTIRRVMRGVPMGHALEPFNIRYAEMTAEIAYLNDAHRFGADTGSRHAEAFRYYRDARNFIVLGDPAVRLLPILIPEVAR